MMLLADLSTPLQEHQKRFDTLVEIAAQAEIVARDFFARRDVLILEQKSPTDFVTDADRAVERCIRLEIAKSFPNDFVVGEELGGQEGQSYWLVDPIDGTSNFLSGLPLWAISIAYIENGHPIFGLVSIPMLNRCLLGGQAFGLQDLGRRRGAACGASKVFGIGYNEHWPPNRRELIEAQLRSHGLSSLTLGSCATSLALVASGELAGYAEGNVGYWDVAGGIALCEAANVSVSYAATSGKKSTFIAAGSASIQPLIYDITKSNPVSPT
ncbi:inositol monophosphatase [Pacificibacter sp. AS14]|uniref:inositol monophosphatase family protein n=1 Tax=Pacificibacter sp. AS14 TaxID=3135785 RepID=UPI00316B784E